ncbi:MAG TPA: glycerol-3-phosphate acyltransferase [Anaerolineae bacterium]|nr:glycerol-3-phosphate acyltransferase [Anaerolineae bacterium]HID84301.1 glycerol-3-phosphate acyltransferase [Anaerolineales bacterium]HIQ09154.1 glycerol-3-phosphate acyltransferase [Anaerolineaceae bacterium]
MQPYLEAIGLLFVAYLLGSIPFGYVIVKVTRGEDVRRIQSGRTGGTNTMRAAGFWAGLITAILDITKGALSVWLARAVFPGNPWMHILAPVMVIIGHNYSLVLAERGEEGKLRFFGGAGGTPCVGGSVGLWPPMLFILPPLGALVLFGIGYASVATMSMAFLSTVIFAYRAYLGLSPWPYAVYGLLSLALIMWALRPNIRRLLNGTERLVGWRAKRRQQRSE